jgi:hypothetical protein
MKRWRTDVVALRRFFLAAFCLALAAGWAPKLRAEARPHAATLPSEAFKRLDDTIRGEIESRKIPGGILLLQ